MLSQKIEEGRSIGQDWWALYTKHQHESAIAEKLSIRGYEVFLPLYKTVRRWQDRSKQITVPLFPCYLFVRAGVGSRLGMMTIPGVHMIVSRAEQPASIPDEEIQAIRRAVGATSAVEPHPFLKCGDRVRMKRGPLEGLEGVLVRKKNMYRLVLSIDMLAQSVACEVDAADVDALPVAREMGAPLYALADAQRPGVYSGSYSHRAI